jgi:hypothetical protein
MVSLVSLAVPLWTTAQDNRSQAKPKLKTYKLIDIGTFGGPGFYSEHGQPIVDLNALLLPGTDIQVVGAAYINDRGEIAGTGMLPNGDVHAIVLIPVRETAVPPTPF